MTPPGVRVGSTPTTSPTSYGFTGDSERTRAIGASNFMGTERKNSYSSGSSVEETLGVQPASWGASPEWGTDTDTGDGSHMAAGGHAMELPGSGMDVGKRQERLVLAMKRDAATNAQFPGAGNHLESSVFESESFLSF